MFIWKSTHKVFISSTPKQKKTKQLIYWWIYYSVSVHLSVQCSYCALVILWRIQLQKLILEIVANISYKSVLWKCKGSLALPTYWVNGRKDCFNLFVILKNQWEPIYFMFYNSLLYTLSRFARKDSVLCPTEPNFPFLIHDPLACHQLKKCYQYKRSSAVMWDLHLWKWEYCSSQLENITNNQFILTLRKP